MRLPPNLRSGRAIVHIGLIAELQLELSLLLKKSRIHLIQPVEVGMRFGDEFGSFDHRRAFHRRIGENQLNSSLDCPTTVLNSHRIPLYRHLVDSKQKNCLTSAPNASMSARRSIDAAEGMMSTILYLPKISY